eukprot:4788057-Amphidinium_carterae.1
MEAHWADLHLRPKDLADHPSTTKHTLFSIVSGLRMGGPPGLTVQGLKRTISVLQICLGNFQVGYPNGWTLLAKCIWFYQY